MLPPRIFLAREFPYLPIGAMGQLLVVNFHYTFRSELGTSSLDVARTLGRQKYNVHPLIYDVVGATACDADGHRALGLVYLLFSQFALSPLSLVTMTHVFNYMDYAWLKWCEHTIESYKQSTPAAVATASRAMDTLLRALDEDPRAHFGYDAAAFHGVLTATEFLARFERWRPAPGDEAGARRTHAVIIETPLTSEPLPARTEPPASEPSSSVIDALQAEGESDAATFARIEALAVRCGLGPQPYESLTNNAFGELLDEARKRWKRDTAHGSRRRA